MKLEILRDQDADDPRDAFDNLGTLVCGHSRRRALGDHYIDRSEVGAWVRQHIKDSICVRVFAYEHSCLRLSTIPFNDRWGSGQVGVIYADKDLVRREYRRKRISQALELKIRHILDHEIVVKDWWLNGQVWGWRLARDDGTVDACWGYYGDDLDSTGLRGSVPQEAHHLLEQAWEARR